MWAMRLCPERVWDTPSLVPAAHRLGGEFQRSECGFSPRALASETNTRARSAHCRVNVPVGNLEVDRSRRGGTEKVQPTACDVDTLSDRSWSLTRLSKFCFRSTTSPSFKRQSPYRIFNFLKRSEAPWRSSRLLCDGSRANQLG
jgi:hypothetical protein